MSTRTQGKPQRAGRTRALRRTVLLLAGLFWLVTLTGCNRKGTSVLQLNPTPPTPFTPPTPTATPTPTPTGVSVGATANPDSMAFISANPANAALLGSGAASNSILTFEVRNQLGQPLEDVCVSFTLANGGLGGGERINPGLAPATNCTQVTDANGQILTIFRAGTRAGTVNVVAWIDADMDNVVDVTEIQASGTVAVTSGAPSGKHLALRTEQINVPRILEPDGNIKTSQLGAQTQISAILADRFTNPVPDGTAVQFQTFDPTLREPASSIQGSGATADNSSRVDVNAIADTPSPSDGIIQAVGFTQGGDDASVLSLVKRPTDNMLLAGTNAGGVYRSLRDGASWSLWKLGGEPATGLLNGFVNDMTINPANPDQVFAATNEGMYASDTGVNWDRADGDRRIFNEIATPVCGPPCDRWRTRHPFANIARIVPKIAGVLPRDQNNDPVYDYSVTENAGELRFFTTPENGANPNFVDNVTISYDNAARLPDRPIKAVVADPNDTVTGTLYAGILGGGVFRTTDAGMSWTEISGGLTTLAVQSLAFDADRGRLYAGTDGFGVFRCDNPGAANPTWAPYNSAAGLALLDLNVTSIAVANDGSAANEDLVCVGTFSAGVQCTGSGTAAWAVPTGDSFRTASPPDAQVTRVRATGPNSFVAVTTDDENPDVLIGNIWRSTTNPPNFGAPLAAAGLNNKFLNDVIVDGPEIVVATRGRAVFHSVDSGATFTDITGTAPDRINNNLYDGVIVNYGGDTELEVYVDPHISIGGVGGAIAPGERREIRILIFEDANRRPLARDTVITVSETKIPGEEARGGVSRTFSFTLDDVFRAGNDVTEFHTAIFNGGVGADTSVTLNVGITSANGNETFAFGPFNLTP